MGTSTFLLSNPLFGTQCPKVAHSVAVSTALTIATLGRTHTSKLNINRQSMHG